MEYIIILCCGKENEELSSISLLLELNKYFVLMYKACFFKNQALFYCKKIF